MKNMKKWIMLAVIFLLTIGSAGCSTGASEQDNNDAYKTVGIVVTKMQLEDETLSYTGIIEPDVVKNLSFKMSGRINEIFIHEGDYVEEGTKLATIDAQDIMMQAEGLESQIQAAKKEGRKADEAFLYSKEQYDHYTTLYENGAVSKATLDAKSLAYEQAQLNSGITQDNINRLLSEKTRLFESIEDGTLYADQSGVVNSIMFEESEFVAPGQPVLIIGSREQKLIIQVTREDRKRMESGQKIYYTIDNEKKEGSIIFVDRVADTLTSTYKVEIGIDEEELLSGTIARVEVVVGKSEGIWIPIQCIQSNTNDFVYVVEEGKSKKRSIKVVTIKEDQALVEGLEEEEQLVVSGMKSLVEGMSVEIQELEV